jgi:hypothetical protein
MAADRVTEIILDALKRGIMQPGEHRLYRSGKLDGLFPGRSGVNAEAAAHAICEGLLEIVRNENKGKTVIEWVRATPKAVEYLHQRESPLRALEELRDELRAAKESVPAWQSQMRRDLSGLTERLAEDSAKMLQRLDALALRVEEALQRLDLIGPNLPEAITRNIPWAQEAVGYLAKRREGGAPGPCPLPELFGVLAGRQGDFSVAVFHDGLRRLHERRLLNLLPPIATADEMAQPEYALFDGGSVFYYVTP